LKHDRRTNDGDLVKLYLADLSRFPLLTKDDEIRLAQCIEQGRAACEALGNGMRKMPAEERDLRRAVRRADEARLTFVQSNLRLVVAIARRYQSSAVPLLDCIQEGNFGLLHAVEKFDWRKGFKFSTYATWWIRQSIARGIGNHHRAVRVPTHVGDVVARLRAKRFEIESRLGRPPTVSELATELGISEAKVHQLAIFERSAVSIFEPISEDGAVLADVIADETADAPDDAAIAALMPEAMQHVLAPLTDRERKIITLRFGLDRGEPRTLEEVAAHFGLTRERIRQIEVQAMARLREWNVGPDVRALLTA
jgi:DNA-directed RNA polymerase sigma subunit (sigma70/sigma32)